MAELDTNLIARCSSLDKVRWQADAVRAGKSFGEWVREALNEAGGRVPAVREEGKTERVQAEAVRTDETPGVGRVGAVQSDSFETERERARRLAQATGKCTADVERGMRCRLCGQKH